MVFFVMMQLFNGDYISLLFYEKTILGLIHRDTVFHASISNIIDTYGVASTGLHGTPYIHYHWGSHLLFASYINLFNISGLLFYNLIYPILFLSIFAKASFLFLESFEIVRKLKASSWLIPIVAILIFTFFGTSEFFLGYPLGSQSTIVAITFIWIYLSILFESHKGWSSVPFQFMFFTIVLVLLVFLLKISSGLIFFVGLSYAYLRVEPNWKTIVFIGLTSVFILGIMMLIFPADRISSPEIPPSPISLYLFISDKLGIFWKLLKGLPVALIGIIALVILILKNESINRFSDLIKILDSKKYLAVEALAIMNLAAIVTGMYLVFFTEGKSVDVLYFVSTPVFLSLALFVYPIKKGLQSIGSQPLVFSLVMVFILLMIISKPSVAPLILDRYYTQQKMTNLDKQQLILQQLLKNLEKLRLENNDHKIAIYISPSETWYYRSQTYRDIAAPFIVPAMSGISLIGGVPEFILNSGRTTYGFYTYLNLPKLPLFNKNTALKIAQEMNFEELIIFTTNNGNLIQERILLKNQSF